MPVLIGVPSEPQLLLNGSGPPVQLLYVDEISKYQQVPEIHLRYGYPWSGKCPEDVGKIDHVGGGPFATERREYFLRIDGKTAFESNDRTTAAVTALMGASESQ